jgi:demethylmenaquinone methyltransferase/2-methoxy-6-polyprenyl-1,4-benzoquinol methylase
LFPDYIHRNVASITGVDISPEMVKIAKEKFHDSKVEVICADIQTVDLEEKVDSVMIYNAFPHFPEPEKLFAHLYECMKGNGRITVAHGMSRERIDAHHRGGASKVSCGLMKADQLAAMMSKWFKMDTIISDDEKYIVSGQKCEV